MCFDCYKKNNKSYVVKKLYLIVKSVKIQMKLFVFVYSIFIQNSLIVYQTRCYSKCQRLHFTSVLFS